MAEVRDARQFLGQIITNSVNFHHELFQISRRYKVNTVFFYHIAFICYYSLIIIIIVYSYMYILRVLYELPSRTTLDFLTTGF